MSIHSDRGEINLNLAKKLNKKWSVGLLSHASTLQNRLDKNDDGFLDIPLYNQYNVINRWKYSSDKYTWYNWVSRLIRRPLRWTNWFQTRAKRFIINLWFW
ncbi:MAG: hypothetical protein IPH28_20195 [Cytophagaceae bacterium]|nr:hypothetical protein [Cytophagaceae bacterium]